MSGTTTIRAVAIAGGIHSLLAAALYTVATPTIALVPSSTTLSSSQSQAFTASISGASNGAAGWSLDPNAGNISASGIYTAPAFNSSEQTISPAATSAADPSASARASVVLAPAVNVALTPSTASLAPSQTQSFTATVTNAANPAVTWSLSPAVGSITATGVYTAPPAEPASATVTITATSVSSPTKSSSAQVTIVPAQAANYGLVWQDTFPTLSLCATNRDGCNWWPGVWNQPSGLITDPTGTYVNLNWTNAQSSQTTTLTSASSNRAYHHAWSYGYFEVSMAFNPVTGNWPAIWMLPVSAIGESKTTGGELDIFEWNSQLPTTFVGTVHVWNNGSEIANNEGKNAWPVPKGTTFQSYNTYGVLWTPNDISWYFNDVLMGTASITSAPYKAAFGPRQPYFLILSEQAGCNWTYTTNVPCPNQFSPLNMQVQWIHIYRIPGT